MARGMSTNSKSQNTRPELEYTRLHIAPLNPALLQSVLPQAVLPLAQNISYHSIQTFPEKDFGFLDLPAMEAQKIKKRLNGSILKGTKVKVEEARPPKQKDAAGGDTTKSSQANKDEIERPSKRKRIGTEILPAVELQGRKVKRGWTDPIASRRSDKKEKKMKGKNETMKSKYTSNPECLFKTTLPANVAASLNDGTLIADSKGRWKKKKDKEVVVHEFSKTMKHATFLRSSEAPSTANGVCKFVDDQGWVNDEGNIIEAAVTKRKKVTKPKGTATDKFQGAESSSDSDESSVVEPLSDSEDDIAGPEVGEMLSEVSQRLASQGSSASDSETSSSGTSSSGTSSDDGDSDEEDPDLGLSESEYSYEGEITLDAIATDSGSTTTPTKLKLDIPKTINDAEPGAPVHPLEALFKRRRPDLQAPKLPDPVPSFTFFDADVDEGEGSDDGVSYIVPMTPFTRQDLEFRGQRSAAPTPDTAYPGKPYETWPTSNPANETDEVGDATPTRKGKNSKDASMVAAKEEPVSDFQKWFYEHRGEANRAWKRRRKLVAKEKRQRENRKNNERLV